MSPLTPRLASYRVLPPEVAWKKHVSQILGLRLLPPNHVKFNLFVSSAALASSVLGFSTQSDCPGSPIFFFFFLVVLGLHWWHMEVPRLRVESELPLPAYTTATATRDLMVCFHTIRPYFFLFPKYLKFGLIISFLEQNTFIGFPFLILFYTFVEGKFNV